MAKATTIAVTGLVLIGAAGGGGYWYGSKKYAEANIMLSQQAEAAQRRLERVGNLNHLLNGRIELYKAAAQLDQRNFGLANSHLRNAAAALAAVDVAAVGIDATAFNALRDAVAKTDIAVAVDLEAQRSSVLKYSADLDALLPRSEKPVASAAAPSTMTPAPVPSVPASTEVPATSPQAPAPVEKERVPVESKDTK